MPKQKLTKRAVEAAAIPASGVNVVNDSEIAGFHLRVHPTGKRSYYLHYRRHGREHRPKIGQHGAITADEARGIAQSWKGMLARGEDPAEEMRRPAQSISVADLFSRFQEWAAPRHKTRTIEHNNFLFRSAIGPAFGKRWIDEITRTDIERFHASLSAQPTKANHALTLLKTLFNKAIRWEATSRVDNPCAGILKFPEGRHERYLSAQEVERLHAVLDRYEQASLAPAAAIGAIRLLLHTGCRRGEILGLTWDEVDFVREELVLRDSKTGRKRIYLNDPALAVLHALKQTASGQFVVQGKNEDKPLQGLEKIWQRIRRDAGLTDVRLHDLRHSFASFAIAQGLSLSEVGAALGHKDVRTTQRYAHLSEAQVRNAVRQVGRATSRQALKSA